MPFFYGVEPAVDFTTSATPATEVDAMFIAAGAGRQTNLVKVTVQGKAAAVTSGLSGIVNRVKTYPTTASAGGTGVTPTPRDVDAPAAKSTAGQASAGVTPGTGTLVVHQIIGCSISGPGGWFALTDDEAVRTEASGVGAKSIDFFNSSNTASLKVEIDATIKE